MVIKTLDLTSCTPADRVSALLNMPADELLAKLGAALPTTVVTDDDIIFGSPTYAAITHGLDSEFPQPGKQWVESIMVGDCAFDGNVMSLEFGHRKHESASLFAKAASSILSPTDADELLDIYGLGAPATTPSDDDDDETAFQGLLDFGNDAGFYAPTLAYAKAFSEGEATEAKRVFVYRFNALNPWDGPWKGTSSHVFDTVLLFQNFNEFLAEKQRAVAAGFAARFLEFVRGDEPWEAWGSGAGDRKALLIEDDGMRVCSDRPELVGRRRRFVEFGERVGWDVVAGVLMALSQA